MSNPNVHVVHKGDNWAVEKEGAQRTAGKFSTQQEAIEAGRKIAKEECVELIIHAEDGSIRKRDSYGNDPRDVPG